jgi:hypothetical protein
MMTAEVLPFQQKQVSTQLGIKVPQVVYVVVEDIEWSDIIRSVHRTLEGAKRAALFYLDTEIVKMELED